ncbi:alpha/beta-hydrolase [Lactarius pseudohatsudake]|nr:alpha/beta-hydrolase [Lactarius pseudohatsudake]
MVYPCVVMSHDEWKTAGVFAYKDTGVPTGTTSEGRYSTLVMVHGLASPAGVFSRLAQKAGKLGARVVLINRRGYPFSKPFSDEERALLVSSADDTLGDQSKVDDFVKGLARELYDFLILLVSAGDIPPKSITLAGWSLGTLWMAAFLAHAPSFPATNVALHQYFRRVITYDPMPQLLGYHPPERYNLPSNPSVAPGEHGKVFLTSVSGYFAHGDTPETLTHDALSEPGPSIENMSPEDLLQNLYEEAAKPDSLDFLLIYSGIKQGTFDRLHDAALFPSHATASDREWGDIEFRVVWCDRTIGLIVWGAWAFEAEMAESAKEGKDSVKKRMRKCSIVRMHGANHFAHWDEPERTLMVLLADEPDMNLVMPNRLTCTVQHSE